MTVSTLRAGIAVMVVSLLGAGCGGVSADPGPAPTSVATSSPGGSSSTTEGPSSPDLAARVVAWCGEQTVDFCRWGLETVGFERTAPRLECLIASSSINEFINSECNRDPQPPPTTIPDPTVTVPQADFAALTSVEQWMRRVLTETHPDDPVEAGVVLAKPASLGDADGLVTSLGAQPLAVWRRDWVCFDPYAENGLPGWPGQAARFAYLDGSAEAGRIRAAAEASGEPIFGRDFFEAQLTLLVLASEAVHEPGVEIEAVVAGVPLRDVEAIENAPGVAAVRVLHASERGIWPEDLTPADAPDCG